MDKHKATPCVSLKKKILQRKRSQRMFQMSDKIWQRVNMITAACRGRICEKLIWWKVEV